MGSLIIAGHFVIPEVCIFFRDRLLRGNRSKKIDSFSLQAFGTPNFPDLGRAGINLTFRKDLLLIKPNGNYKFSVCKNMETQIATVKMTPFFPRSFFDNMFKNGEIKGCVIECFGVGNFPTKRIDLLKELEKASKLGKVIVYIT